MSAVLEPGTGRPLAGAVSHDAPAAGTPGRFPHRGLWLYATIESARAGEASRGFGVVGQTREALALRVARFRRPDGATTMGLVPAVVRAGSVH